MRYILVALCEEQSVVCTYCNKSIELNLCEIGTSEQYKNSFLYHQEANYPYVCPHCGERLRLYFDEDNWLRCKFSAPYEL